VRPSRSVEKESADTSPPASIRELAGGQSERSKPGNLCRLRFPAHWLMRRDMSFIRTRFRGLFRQHRLMWICEHQFAEFRHVRRPPSSLPRTTGTIGARVEAAYCEPGTFSNQAGAAAGGGDSKKAPRGSAASQRDWVNVPCGHYTLKRPACRPQSTAYADRGRQQASRAEPKPRPLYHYFASCAVSVTITAVVHRRPAQPAAASSGARSSAADQAT